jgi:hypothetical protein
MSRIYKTARGKQVDIDRIKLSNETAIAIGNMKVNARGDLIGAGGQITAGRNQIMDQAYAVGEGYSPTNSAQVAKKQAAVDATKAKALHDLANNLVEPKINEPVVDPDAPSTPARRGTLASSVAKPTTVNQGPVTDPRKPKGPSRI